MKFSSSASAASAWAFGVLVAGFIAWASLVDLDYGVHAMGTVANKFATMPIQHNSIARVKEVHVVEGQSVKAGDKLVTLDDADAVAQAGSAESQRIVLRLQLDSLISELRGEGTIPRPQSHLGVVPEIVITRAHTEAVEALRQRLASHQAQLAQLDGEIRAAHTQVRSLSEEVSRLSEQVAMVDRQIDAMAPIARDRLLSQTVVDEQRIRSADLQRQRTARLAEKSAQEAMIDQVRSRRNVYSADREKTIRGRLSELEPQVKASEQAVAAAESRLKALTVQAAVDGQVINVKVRTPGAVVEPGRPMMDLVQDRRSYFVEARVNVAEIENVRKDMPAEVTFVTLPSKSTPYVDGYLETVASNSSINEKTGEEFYVVSVAFKQDITQSLGFEPTLGMPVQVLLKGGRRSVMSYLIDPFRVLMRKAMKES